jgi:hypothetical protein
LSSFWRTKIRTVIPWRHNNAITWPHSKHRHGLPICVVTTMHGYWLCLRLANTTRRNSHHNRVGVVDVNSRYPPRMNVLNKNGGRNFQPFDSRPLRLNKTIMNGQRPTLDISNLLSQLFHVTFQILSSKFQFDLMHWNVSIGPDKWPIFH